MAKDQWTVDTLKEHLDAIVAANDTRYEQRFVDQKVAVDAALNAAERAVMKAETATERRFEGVNEFRAQLADQQRTFLPRAEYEARHNTVTDRLDLLERSQAMETGHQLGAAQMIGYVIGVIGVLTAIITVIVTHH